MLRHKPDFVLSERMTKSIRDSKKSKPKIGRPKTTGPGEPQVVRMHDQQIAAIDEWISIQATEISRPEAIRRLVDIGLTAHSKPRRQSTVLADRAKELATTAIEGIIDPSMPAEERAQRRRRLSKGPAEFREDRVDQPKAKK
jgi:hypothetical protein